MASNFELRASNRLSTLDCLHSSLQIEFDWPAQVRQAAEQQRDKELEREREQDLEEKQAEKRERRKAQREEKKREGKAKSQLSLKRTLINYALMNALEFLSVEPQDRLFCWRWEVCRAGLGAASSQGDKEERGNC